MYATLSDVQIFISDQDLIQLTDDENTGSMITSTIDKMLEAATVEIDGYIGSKYPLPLATVPTILINICTDIGIFNLYARRHGPPEHWQTRYDNAVKKLGLIAKGDDISLGVNDPEGTGASDLAATSSSSKVFSMETLKNF